MAQIYPFQSKHKRPSAQTTSENKKTLLELIEINKRLQSKNDLYEEEELRYTDMTEAEWHWLKEKFKGDE